MTRFLIFAIIVFTISLMEALPAIADEPVKSYDECLNMFDESLQKYVTDGFVDYAAWTKDQDFEGLNAYAKCLNEVKLDALSVNEEKALYINAYNALMILWILNNYPLDTVRETRKPFKGKHWMLAGEKVSLDNIEHDHLRKMGDPRIHFAIVCASIGCPDLASTVYRTETLDSQLDSAATLFFSKEKGLRVETTDKGKVVIHLSKILDWFGGDFGGSKTDKLNFVAKYAPADVSELIAKHAAEAKVEYIKYDWMLNGK